MDNFGPYVKLQFQMIKDYILGMVIMAVFFWFSLEIIIGFFLFPLLLAAIVWPWSKISEKLTEESLFGPQAGFYMGLPVSEETIIASRILLLGVCDSVGILCMVLPFALSSIFRGAVIEFLSTVMTDSHRGWLFVLMLLLILTLSFIMPAVSLVKTIRYHALPLRKQARRLNYPGRVAVNLLIWVFIWTALRSHVWRTLLGLVRQWLAGPLAIPVAVVLLTAAIFFTAKAFRAGVRLMKDRYQWT